MEDNNTIFQVLNKDEIFSIEEIKHLSNSIEIIIREYLTNNICSIICADFDKNITDYICNIYLDQLVSTYGDEFQFIIKFKLLHIIQNIKNKVHQSVMPKRSYNYSFIRKIVFNEKNLTQKIEYLRSIPQPIQRSAEWYTFRQNLLTASSIWKVFSTDCNKNQLIYDKCQPYTEFKSPSLDSPLHWGQKYEPVSLKFYEHLYNTKIEEFGCIKHNKYEYIGASPDGININPLNPRYGRMLEIKNIVNRVMNGIPKMEYWIQMQLQMETCNLNECDFLETKFIEYDSEDDFNNDGSFTYTDDRKLKGIMILFSNNGNFHYEYAPLYTAVDNYNKWETEILEKNKEMVWVKNIYWKLQEYSNILVLRNKLWFNTILPQITEFWNTICQEKITGYEHRKPKKRRSNINDNNIFNSKKCLISI